MRSWLPMILDEFGRFGWVCRAKVIKIGEADFPMLWEVKYTTHSGFELPNKPYKALQQLGDMGGGYVFAKRAGGNDVLMRA